MVSGSTTYSGSNAWQSGMIKVSGGELAYHRTGGTKPPLVLSHGLTDNGLCWSRLARELEADFDIVMLDARGHGDSSRIPTDDDNYQGRDIVEAIQELELHFPFVMGHSVGAIAAALLAAECPQLAAKVILEDPPFVPETEAALRSKRREKFRQQVAEFQTMTDAEITEMGMKLSPSWHMDEFPAWTLGKRQVDPEAMPLSFPPWRSTVAAIKCPTLLIYGEPKLGGIVTDEIANEAMALNPKIKATAITGAGHNIRRENFQAFVSEVRNFLTCTPHS